MEFSVLDAKDMRYLLGAEETGWRFSGINFGFEQLMLGGRMLKTTARLAAYPWHWHGKMDEAKTTRSIIRG